MILKQLPDLSPRPSTPAQAEFRRWFYERWGRENAIILGRATRAEYPPFTQTLSIKRAWGGSEDYLLRGRRLAVGGTYCLILNEGAHYGARIASPTPVTSMAVFFRPRVAQELAGAAAQSPQQMLDTEQQAPLSECSFAEHLRPLSPALDHRLSRMRDAVIAGEDDEQWLEEQVQALLWEMLASERGWRSRGLALADLCRSAHVELLARLDRVTDYMISCHAQPLTLDELAVVARLSKFHFVRLFRRVHGVTPMAFLARLRTRAAERLVLDTTLALDEVAELSGFGSRQTLFRQLRRYSGDGGRALRRRPALEPEI